MFFFEGFGLESYSNTGAFHSLLGTETTVLK